MKTNSKQLQPLNMRNVLVVEDNKDIAQLVSMHLGDIGANVTVSHTGTDGLMQAQTNPFDLVILDLMLPGIDGLDICRRLRSQAEYIPILMLTAKSAELDRVLGLEIGADDYLTKPFSIRELIARVKAIFRRVDSLNVNAVTANNAVQSNSIRCNELYVEDIKRTATLRDQELDLTAKEFDLLWHFANHPGQVFTRNQLLDNIWGYGHDGYEHTVNSHINRLRSKLEQDPSKPIYILTVWGVGYKFTDHCETK